MHFLEVKRRAFLSSRLHLLTFVLQVVIITGVGLEVTLSPPELTVFEGEDAKFTCSPLIPVAVPILEQNDFVVTKEHNPRISFTDNGLGSMEANRTYTLSDVTLGDNGTRFRCTVAGFMSNTIWMSVFVRPRITGTSGLVTILENSTTPTTLTYSAFGIPQPHSYQWLRDGERYFGNGRIRITTGDVSSLEIRSPSREDSASYTLVAVSSVGQGTLTVELQVVYNEYLEVPEDHEVPVGTTITLRCVHKFGWSYTWRSNRRWISTDDGKVSIGLSSSTLHYGPVDYTDDLMDFYCLTRLANGHYFTSPSAILRVLYAPIISVPQNYSVIEGSDVHITFDILAHPAPHTLQYFFNGLPLDLSQGFSSSNGRMMLVADRKGTLLIKNVRRSDEGVYSLYAVNDYGEDTSQTHLFVLYIPIITHQQDSIIVQVNRPAVIPCGQQVLSNPPATFSWSKFPNQAIRPQLQPTIDPQNGSLLLSAAVTYADSGTYTCTAENSVGPASTLVKVVVLDPPDPPRNIRVNGTGSSWATIKWVPPLNIGPLPPLSMYRIIATPRRNSPNSDSVNELIARITNLETRNQSQDGVSNEIYQSFREFDPNSTCVEVICETITTSVEARFTQVNVTGLVPAHTYDLVIQSLSNGSNLVSEPSVAISIITQPHVPSIGGVTSTVYGPGAAVVYWTLAYSGGLPVQFFEISFKKVNDSSWQDSLNVTGSNGILPEFRSWIVNRLESVELYLFRVRAMNDLGYGNYTETEFAILSHIEGVPSPPTRPTIAAWAEDYVIITSSLIKIGTVDTENVTLSVMLILDGMELERQMFELVDNYTLGEELQLEFVNLTYRGDWQFAVSCTNTLGESLPSPVSLHAQESIQESRTLYDIGGPVVGCIVGAINMAILTMVIIMFVVMGQETRQQQQSLARRVEMSQAVNVNESPATDCPFSPHTLINRSSPDGRSNTARATPSETVYAEICRQTCPISFVLPTSQSTVSAV